MDNINAVLATNIQTYRKQCNMTQEELADKLGVTFQAVSKWENAKSAPDISFLPTMADLFGCCIDELFSRKTNVGKQYEACEELPWDDDGIFRGAVFEGRKMLNSQDPLIDKFTFVVIGDVRRELRSECSVIVNGSVSGGCFAGGDLTVRQSVSGGASCGHDMEIGGVLTGGCRSCHSLSCEGDVVGSVQCDGSITVNGDVKAEKIRGNVICRSLECDQVDGNMTIHKDND